MITLYDADRCPYCARVRIVLAEKGIEYETVVIDLADRPDWLYEKNPLGKVPVLEEDAFVLPESEVIMEYLEERYPEPAAPAGRPGATGRSCGSRSSASTPTSATRYYAFRRGEDHAEERLGHCLSFFERNLDRWRGRYGLAEIAYVPWLIRLRDLLGFDLSPYPALLERLDELCERPGDRRRGRRRRRPAR